MQRLRQRAALVAITLLVLYIAQITLLARQAGQVTPSLLMLPLQEVVSSTPLGNMLHVQPPAATVLRPRPLPPGVDTSPLPHALSLAQVRATQLGVSGGIQIPRLGVLAPLYEGAVRSGNMVIASGYSATHFLSSVPPGTLGNAVIYGHDDIEGSIFAHLDLLRPGDPIYVWTTAGTVTYRVQNTRVVWPNDLSPLRASNEPLLTLLTCTPYQIDTQRLVVTAILQPA